jgi:hypothetical protein
VGVKEKKAISDPEANPETNKRRQATMPAMIAPEDGDNRVTSLKIRRNSSII